MTHELEFLEHVNFSPEADPRPSDNTVWKISFNDIRIPRAIFPRERYHGRSKLENVHYSWRHLESRENIAFKVHLEIQKFKKFIFTKNDHVSKINYVPGDKLTIFSTSIDLKTNAVVCQLLRLFAVKNDGNVILDL